MSSLPLVPASCALDQDGVGAQGARYRLAGEGAEVLERSPRRLLVRVGQQVEGRVIDELVAVERRCCPFFALAWEPAERRLEVSVSRREDEPALDAVILALGLAPWAR